MISEPICWRNREDWRARDSSGQSISRSGSSSVVPATSRVGSGTRGVAKAPFGGHHMDDPRISLRRDGRVDWLW